MVKDMYQKRKQRENNKTNDRDINDNKTNINW